MKPTTYENWKHCITISCGIPLTQDYLENRLTEMNDSRNYQTQKFKKTWGDNHHFQVMRWFERARKELSY